MTWVSGFSSAKASRKTSLLHDIDVGNRSSSPRPVSGGRGNRCLGTPPPSQPEGSLQIEGPERGSGATAHVRPEPSSIVREAWSRGGSGPSGKYPAVIAR